MDGVDDLRASAWGMRWWRGAGRRRKVDNGRREEEAEDEELVEVLLRGKAPWGFTLRGGSEHREPLLITKVEQGSAAEAVRLLAGDEMVSVNAVPLGGSRQEAICLVKSSHRTLTLVVRRPRMVDVVSPRTMPSETEVHVARSFLTKILRSSMRKNRFKGNVKNDPGSRPHSWHSSKLTEESDPTGTEATPAPVWQPKHEASHRSKELSAQGEQNTQLQITSQFSSVTNMERLDRPAHAFPPGRLSPTKYMSGAEPLGGPAGKRDSTFNCFTNGSSPPIHDLSACGRKGTSAENIFFKGLQTEGLQHAGRPRYLQPTLGSGGWEGPRAEEQLTSCVSIPGRPSVGPVWQVPEKKSQSPPPPPPPLRSDSFAATKVFPYSEGPGAHTKIHGRSVEKLSDSSEQNGLKSHQQKPPENRHSFIPPLAKDFLHPSTAAVAADHKHNQLHPNKLFSLSSTDVRQSHYTNTPDHQRQYSDESPFYLQTRSAPSAKTQSVGSYYRSLQDLPANVFNRKHVQHSSSAANTNMESCGNSRYYGPASKHPFQTAELQTRKGNIKSKYSLPQSQMPYSENKERNGHSNPGNGLQYDHQTSEHSIQSRSAEEAAKRSEGQNVMSDMKRQCPPNNDQKVTHTRQQDLWVPQEDHRISPLKTPLLHSLAQESLAERQSAATTVCFMSAQETGDIPAMGSGKVNRRSDRYATTLRKEIQQKRAQLQKSRSAATLTCDAEEDEVEEWRASQASTSSNTYKDHLKEAQARVLQATSFQRRDLEPLGPEMAVPKSTNGRIRGRKRFPLAKRTHSFSEPDKINKVGMEVDPQRESFGERRRFFEAKPASSTVLKASQGSNLNADLSEKQPEETHSSTESRHLSPGQKQKLVEQQRLGTFAEYQATWNQQKKSTEVKTQGRYHSAENILDTDAEEKVVCTHERSRSSPSADFYTQNIPSSWRDPQAQQSSHTSRAKSENGPQYSPDSGAQSIITEPSLPRNEGPAPGLSDHRTKPIASNHSQTTLSSGPRSLSPNPGSQHPAQPPQAKGLLPLPRQHLGPETTSSSQEFLPGSQSNLQPVSSGSSDSQQHVSVPPGSAPATSSQPSWTSLPDDSKEDVAQEKQQLAPPLSPLSSWPTALSPPPPDRARSPSLQFAPPRLTDKPPTSSVQDDSTRRSENGTRPAEVMDVNSPARKVPVRIIHAESISEQKGRAYLPQSADTNSTFQPPPYFPSLGTPENPASSLFSIYTRQGTQEPAQVSSSVPESSSAVEEAKREELARDIMGRDKSLADILDQSGRMTTMDLMEGLFPPEEQILEGAHQRRRASTSSRLLTASPRSTERRLEEEDLSVSAAASLVPSSSYYNTSAPKAELLIKMKDMQEQLEEQDSEDELDVDLASKKQELISSLAKKLEVLREARQSLQEDVEDNESLGREVEATVQRLCQPNQLDKFRMFVGDLDKVVSLLLSLSGRLARVENALNSLEDDASQEEKRTLTEKRKLLMRQHEDAKELKENLDRRERLVSGIMQVHLDAGSLDDYRHFVKMKSALIIEQRKLEDKVKLGEEQLKCLLDSLPLEQRQETNVWS